MFDMGFSEITLIFVIALIVVGPERLPKLARSVGLWVGKARTVVSSVKTEVERELRVSELKQSIKDQSPIEEFKKLTEDLKSVKSDAEAVGADIKKSVDSAAAAGQDAVAEASAAASVATKPASSMAGAGSAAAASVATAASATDADVAVAAADAATPQVQVQSTGTETTADPSR